MPTFDGGKVNLNKFDCDCEMSFGREKMRLALGVEHELDLIINVYAFYICISYICIYIHLLPANKKAFSLLLVAWSSILPLLTLLPVGNSIGARLVQ